MYTKLLITLTLLGLTLGLSACYDEAKHNPLLQQISADDAEQQHHTAGHYLVETAEKVQPKINAQFQLDYKMADFYVLCMEGKSPNKSACKALYQAMEDKIKVTGHANFMRKQSYEGTTVANLSSPTMWKILANYVADHNCRGKWDCGRINRRAD